MANTDDAKFREQYAATLMATTAVVLLFGWVASTGMHAVVAQIAAALP